MSFVPLQIISAYSLLRSTVNLSQLVKQAKSKGYRALALTDYNVMYGTVRFYNLCKANGIHPILGLTLSIRGLVSNRSYQLILLARNQTGYQNLMKISTLAMTRPEHQLLDWRQIIPYLGGLYVIHPLNQELTWLLRDNDLAGVKQLLQKMTTSVAPKFIKIGVANDLGSDRNLLDRFIKLARQFRVNLVGLSPVKYLGRTGRFDLEVLAAIRNDVKIPSPVKVHRDRSLGRNWLKNGHDLADSFRLSGLAEAAAETKVIAQHCQVTIKKQPARLPHFYDRQEKLSGHGHSSKEYLAHLSRSGLMERFNVKRYQQIPDRYQHRLARELKVIREMGFDDYFLIVWDIMRFIRSHHITTGDGRGSAAGSLVAYVLYITNVDPIKYHLLFERFLNKERAQMPDIDLDIPDVDRDRVLAYVHRKYQSKQSRDSHDPLQERVSQIITFDTMAAKQSIRDVGRVFGLSGSQLNQWSRVIPSVPGITLLQAFQQSSALRNICLYGSQDNANVKLNQLLFKTALHLEGLPRHFSTHAAGLILSDRPLVKLAPLQKGNDRLLMTQYSKNYAEQVGLLKIDFLGLRNLTLLGRILRLVKDHFNPHFNINRINLNDPQTLKLFQNGNTDGVFQFESGGIKQVLRRVKPTDFDLVAIVNALYRPGPIHNIDTFIARKENRQPVTYPDRALKKILAPTYGIIVYQEQVMLVAQVMGGFTLGQADILRRAMSKKKHAIMASMRVKFIHGALHKGFSKPVAQQTFDYMNRFASYGFNKSHAVAYSKLAFQLAYLKAHYSTAFFTALLNSVTGNDRKIRQYLMDAKGLRVKIEPPDVNLSQRDCSIYHQHLLMGLSFLRKISGELINTVIQNRLKGYRDLNQFILRIYPFLLLRFKASRKFRDGRHFINVLSPLIYSGALDGISRYESSTISRDQLKNACYRIFLAVNVGYNRFSGAKFYHTEYQGYLKYRKYRNQNHAPLNSRAYRGYLKYRRALKAFKIKAKSGVKRNRVRIVNNVNSLESLGLKISGSRLDRFTLRRLEYYYLNLDPITLFLPLKKALHTASINDLRSLRGPVQIVVNLKSVRRIRTKRGQPMAFLTGNDALNQVSIVVFPNVYQRFVNYLKLNLVLLISGRIERRSGLQIIANQLVPAANVMSKLRRRRNSRRVYNWHRHCCYLRIDLNHDQFRCRNRLYRLIKKYPGPYPIFLFKVASHKKYLLNSQYAVNRNGVVNQKLSQILGRGNVVFE